MKNLLRASLLIIFCFLNQGCSEPAVIEGLDAEESLQLFTELIENGVQADRSKSTGESFNVTVPQDRLGEALKLVQSMKRQEGVGDKLLESFMSSTSLLPQSKSSTQLKEDTIRALQIERALSNLDGVEQVRVFYADGAFGAVLRHRKGFGDTEARKVLAVASRVDPSDIMLTLQEVKTSTVTTAVGEEVLSLKRVAPFSFSVPSHQKSSTSTELLAFFFIASSLSLTVGVLTGVIIQRRKFAKTK